MAKTEKASLLDGKDITAILLNTPLQHEFAPGKIIAIQAMGDEHLMVVSDAMERIVDVVQALLGQHQDGTLTMEALVASIPTIIRVALPEVTVLIAGSLRISVEDAQAIKAAHKIGILAGILEAEDVPLLIKNGQGLAAMFAGLPTLSKVAQQEAAEELEAEDESSNLTGPPIMSFLQPSTGSASSTSSE